MRKTLCIILILLLIVTSACGRRTAREAKPIQPPEANPVDAVATDISSIDSIEQDLSTDELSDLDAGLSDVENI